MKVDWKLVGFLVTTVLGTGGVWQYQQNRIEKLNYNLDRASRSIELRNQLDSLMEKIILATNEFEPLDLCFNQRWRNKAQEIHLRLNLLKDNFVAIEKSLAEIEQREPRRINLEISPPCPPSRTGIKDG